MALQGECSTDSTILIPDGQTMQLGGFTITAVDLAGRHARLFAFNGQVPGPVLEARAGDSLGLAAPFLIRGDVDAIPDVATAREHRLLNASSSRFYRLTLQDHPMHVIGTDGGALESPDTVEELLMTPANGATCSCSATAGPAPTAC